jgi:membrane protein YdbS with pleckstrin-like domain
MAVATYIHQKAYRTAMERGAPGEWARTHHVETGPDRTTERSPHGATSDLSALVGSPLPLDAPTRFLSRDERHVFRTSPRIRPYASILSARLTLIIPVTVLLITLPRILTSSLGPWALVLLALSVTLSGLGMIASYYLFRRYYTDQAAILEGDTLRIQKRDLFTYKWKIKIHRIKRIRLHQSPLM